MQEASDSEKLVHSAQQILETLQAPMVWTIAGSDNSAGAGIQADNKVFDRFAVDCANIITALTAQNSKGVQGLHASSQLIIEEQCKALAQDRLPDVIKLGMLAQNDTLNWLVQKLPLYSAPVVCDPVLSASSGGKLIEDPKSYLPLLEHIDIFTPNQAEFAKIFSVDFSNMLELEEAAKDIAKLFDINLVVTGGESLLSDACSKRYAIDLCVIDGESFYLESPKQMIKAQHGTGCSFASAIAASLARGFSEYEAVVLAKAYLNQGLSEAANQELLLSTSAKVLEKAFLSKSNFIHTVFPHSLNFLPRVVANYLDENSCEFSQFAQFDAQHDFPTIDSELGLYPVVDSVEWLEKCLVEGVKTIQLRVKEVEAAELDVMVEQAAKLGRKYTARLFINDYWQLAIKHKAYGVHLGQEDLDTADLRLIKQAGLYLGLSTHSWYEIARAHALRPSYIAIGPIYETTTKQMPWQPQGLQKLQAWLNMLNARYPVVAIGGINQDNADQVLATGVGSIAMVRAITEAKNYKKAIAKLNQKIEAL